MNPIIYIVFSCLLVCACSPSYQSFKPINNSKTELPITLETIDISTNGYVGFIIDSSLHPYEFVPQTKYSVIKNNTCYAISTTDLKTLLQEAFVFPSPIILASFQPNNILYTPLEGFTIKNNYYWFIVNKDGKKNKLCETELYKNTFVLLVHKNASTSVLNKIIK